MRTLDQMMSRMGFETTDTGPYVTELRAVVARQMSEGLISRSAGTWAPGNHSAEDRARAFLAYEWSMQQWHSYRVENIDRDWSEQLTMIGDRIREVGFHFRMLRSKLLRRRNPYR